MKKAFLLPVIACLVVFQSFASNTTNPTLNQRSLGEILNEDGTVDLDLATEGSYSTIGYELINDDETGQPTFSLKSGGTDDAWTDPGTVNGVNNSVYAAVVHDGDLYIGGAFYNVGGDANADYIVYWDGDEWRSLGTTPLNSYVQALATDGTDLYVGGYFYDAGGNTSADRIAKWDGSNWIPMGTGANNYVFAIVVDGSNVYIGGQFTSPANRVAKWNGSNWSACGSPQFVSGDIVYALALEVGGASDPYVYVGGLFDSYGGNLTRYHRTGNGWYNIGIGVGNGYVRALEWDTKYYVYVGGDFDDAQGSNDASPVTDADNFARVYAGGNVYAVGTGTSGIVYDIEKIGSNVYIAGSFTSVDGTSASRIAVWNGSSWSSLTNNPNMSSTVRAIAYDDGEDMLYAAGYFSSIDSEPYGRVGMYEPGTNKWWQMGSSPNSTVYAVAVMGGDIYIGGGFINLAGIPEADRIAKWNGSSWSALGTGLSSTVYALAVDGTDLYAGGYFLNAGGIPAADKVAKWDGTNWNACGTPSFASGDYVYALKVGLEETNQYLWVGGIFDSYGGNLAIYIDNLGNWYNQGIGVGNGAVYAIEQDPNIKTYAYIGGNFADAQGYNDGTPNYDADNICKVYANGTVNSALGTGLSSTVRAIKNTSDGSLIVGGAFNSAGGDAFANKIAKWNGSSWEAIGTGMNSTVYSLEIDGENIYAGGLFQNAGNDADADRIAYWDGNQWNAMGTGATSTVRALALNSNNIYAGGSFTVIGDQAIEYFAQYGEVPSITSSSPTTTQTKCQGDAITLTVSATGSGISYQWMRDGVVFSTAASYTNNSLQPSAAGIITCKVSNANGHVYTKPFELIVRADPVITSQPTPDATCQDVGEASFAVGATGYNLSYQWYRRTTYGGARTQITSSTDGGVYNYYTAAGMDINEPSLSMDNYYYECRVYNTCNSTGVYTNQTKLDVYPSTSITNHPSNRYICPGSNTTFSVTATGYSLSYQWQYSTGGSWNNLTNSAPFSGVTSSTLTLTSPSSSYDGYFFRCAVSGDCGTNPVYSNSGELNIYDDVNITAQYNNINACENSTAKLGVQATGTGLYYNWYEYDGTTNFIDDSSATYSGAYTDTLSIAVTDALDGYYYQCKVTGTCGYEYASWKILNVNQAPEITVHPSPQTVCDGDIAQFAVSATGEGTLSYQWESSPNGSTSWTSQGTNSSVLDLTGTAGLDDHYIRCTVTGTCSPSATSNNTTINITPNPSFTTQPSSGTVCEGEEIYFTVAATNYTGLQWQKSTNGTDWYDMAGATGTQISYENASSELDGNQYRCIAFGTCVDATSNIATLTVNEAPVVTI
ncbi:immunoglobulin domain-containing protein, partial [Bacteroidota bacterium]